jgi:hypothetical protein
MGDMDTATYDTVVTTPVVIEPPPAVKVEPPSLPAELRRYFELQRDAAIATVRELDRVLGRPQTIPERKR